MEIIKQGKDIYWKGEGRLVGKGFITKNNTIALQKCPAKDCERENYALNVLSGFCTWCGFNANNRDYTPISKVDYPVVGNPSDLFPPKIP